MSEFDVWDTGDNPSPQEIAIAQRAGEFLSKTWPMVMWEVQVQGGLLTLRVFPWKFDEDDVTRKEEKLIGSRAYAIPLRKLMGDDASYQRTLRTAGGTIMDAFWFDTETGRRIKQRIDQPIG